MMTEAGKCRRTTRSTKKPYGGGVHGCVRAPSEEIVHVPPTGS